MLTQLPVSQWLDFSGSPLGKKKPVGWFWKSPRFIINCEPWVNVSFFISSNLKIQARNVEIAPAFGEAQIYQNSRFARVSLDLQNRENSLVHETFSRLQTWEFFPQQSSTVVLNIITYWLWSFNFVRWSNTRGAAQKFQKYVNKWNYTMDNSPLSRVCTALCSYFINWKLPRRSFTWENLVPSAFPLDRSQRCQIWVDFHPRD